MDKDLRRLLNEFLEQTREYRTYKKDLQFSNEMPEKYTFATREPTLTDLIDWLNGDIDLED